MHKNLWSELARCDTPIVLYGMGDGADKMIAALARIGKKPDAVFASDEFVRGQYFRGYKVLTYAQAKALYPDMTVLVAFGSQLPEVMDNIKRIAGDSTLYAPDLPVYGEGLFDADFVSENKQALETVRSRLCDAASVKVFDCIVNYKLTGDIGFLTECETSVDEAYANILRPGNNERYVDLGAYRGDTVAEFLRYVDGYGKIYAVEPDKKNFSKLYDAFSDRINCINAAVSDSVGKVAFSNKKGRNSHISDCGDMIDSVTVDSIVGDDGASFIKFDVEGNECAAIAGAADTIRNFRPKLCIAAYHRYDDLVSIPQTVLDICPDYKVYIRHFPYIPAWDTNYYFV